MSADTPWPCPILMAIGPDRCPGGLVALLWCPEVGELTRSLLSPVGTVSQDDAAAGRNTHQLAEERVAQGHPLPWVLIYDGDSGVPVSMIRHDYVNPLVGGYR